MIKDSNTRVMAVVDMVKQEKLTTKRLSSGNYEAEYNGATITIFKHDELGQWLYRSKGEKNGDRYDEYGGDAYTTKRAAVIAAKYFVDNCYYHDTLGWCV